MGTNARNDSEDSEGLPDFAVAMRGYDRLQVDEYITRLNRWLEEAQTRTAEAERKLAERPRPVAAPAPAPAAARPAPNGSGDQPMSLDAQQDAAVTRARAHESAANIVNRARAMVKDMEGEAQREAARLLQLAQEGVDA